MRERLPDRRPSVTMPVTWAWANGHESKIVVTIGFDANRQAREVFCADFKVGSDFHALVMDACILMSRLLQHGDTPAELADTMCSPPSLIGIIAQAIVREVADA